MQSSRELAVRLLLTYWPAQCQRGAGAGSGAEKLRHGRAHPCQVCIPMFRLCMVIGVCVRARARAVRAQACSCARVCSRCAR
eukprot:11226019-Lingulodinium_polyedra.AAC.1